MKILAVADEECKALWDYFTPDKLEGVELIIACGDLSRHYSCGYTRLADCYIQSTRISFLPCGLFDNGRCNVLYIVA